MSVMRVESRTPVTFKMELFATIVKGWKPSKIVTKGSLVDVTQIQIPFEHSDNKRSSFIPQLECSSK